MTRFTYFVHRLKGNSKRGQSRSNNSVMEQLGNKILQPSDITFKEIKCQRGTNINNYF